MAPVAGRARCRGRRAHALILCSGTLGAIPFAEKAEAAAAAGFTGISIYAHEHRPGLRAVLDGLGLSVAEVDGATAWMPGQPGTEVARALDVAAELGARSLTVVETTGQPPDPAAAGDAFARVCDEAAALGLRVHLEPFAWSGVAALADAVAIVTAGGRPNGGILLDTWHLVRGPDGGRLPPEAVPSIVALQVSDPLPAPPPGMTLRDECMEHRRLPGAVSAAVAARLPGVPLEVEVFGLAGPPDAAARAAYGALHELARR